MKHDDVTVDGRSRDEFQHSPRTVGAGHEQHIVILDRPNCIGEGVPERVAG